MSGVKTLEVAEDEAGQRLDRWFRRRFPQLGHGRLEKLLRTGRVRVDGARAKAATRLEAGQSVRVPPLPDAPSPTTPARPKPAPVRDSDVRMLHEAVLHRDDAVLAINKPAGLAVQGGSGTSRHLDAMLDALRFGARERPRLVHRLDKDTSGVLLLGRTARAAAALARAFQARGCEKLYWAIVCGLPLPRRGRIDAPLAKQGGRGGERVQIDDEEGRRAVTDYAVIDAALKQAAWLALRPLTGRTHQLRAHCLVLGTPILGDGKYGGRAAFIPGLELDRQLHLHARAIAIAHPNGGILRVEAPLPPHFRRTMQALGFDEAD
ncbi:MAG TPA: RluA family pseudouridine synthase, partial [Alphaproteobacteria bacterium]|nr:RluA family pseudouridine synthase [Alphaproteobacteria bacterium]